MPTASVCWGSKRAAMQKGYGCSYSTQLRKEPKRPSWSVGRHPQQPCTWTATLPPAVPSSIRSSLAAVLTSIRSLLAAALSSIHSLLSAVLFAVNYAVSSDQKPQHCGSKDTPNGTSTLLHPKMDRAAMQATPLLLPQVTPPHMHLHTWTFTHTRAHWQQT
eukprot:1160382-Pelagomonas_calceolata.AAC.7